jgi:hypothetical protein
MVNLTGIVTTVGPMIQARVLAETYRRGVMDIEHGGR